MTLDPLIPRIISIGLGLMFLFAGVHKLKDSTGFRDTLREYRLLPEQLIAPVAFLLPLGEVLLGFSWLFVSWLQSATAVVSAGVLTIYSAAIGINLARGRVHFDCGCSFAGRRGSEQFLSQGLIYRNLILLTAAAIALLPHTARSLQISDFVILSAALLAIFLLYAAANQLLANGAAINTWRKKHA